MNEEIQLLSTKVKPSVDELSHERKIGFHPKSSDVLRQFYEDDETAKYIFDSFVTTTTAYQNCGGFVLTNTEQLEKIYYDPPSRGQELVNNKIFVFAIDGDGSFFGFGLESRKFYQFDFSPWIGEEDPWDECLSNEWDTQSFCDFFEEEFKTNS